MRKIISFLIAIILISTTIIALVGCGDSRKEIKIGYWINNSNEKTNNKYIFDEFEKKFPEYKVTPVSISYDTLYEEVNRMYVGNTLPDVIWMREDYLPSFAEKGIVENLKAYIENDETFDESLYFENALNFCKYNDNLYALPRDIGVQVIAFNKDLMGDTPLPSNDWTWSDLLELSQTLTKKEDDKITQYGFGWTDWKSLVYSNDGELFSDNGQTAQLNKEETVEALQLYSDLANKYGVMPTAEASQGLGNAFTGKKAAFAVVGPWDFAKLKKSNINYDIRSFPKGSSEKAGKMRLSGLQIGISSKSEQKEMAYELVKFLCYNEDAQKLQGEYSIAMPSIKSVAKSDIYVKSIYAPPSIEMYFDALENTFIEPHFEGEIEALSEMNDWLYKIYNNVDNNIVTAESIKNSMNSAIQTILDKY